MQAMKGHLEDVAVDEFLNQFSSARTIAVLHFGVGDLQDLALALNGQVFYKVAIVCDDSVRYMGQVLLDKPAVGFLLRVYDRLSLHI